VWSTHFCPHIRATSERGACTAVSALIDSDEYETAKRDQRLMYIRKLIPGRDRPFLLGANLGRYWMCTHHVKDVAG
jgi:hypothetical protein